MARPVDSEPAALTNPGVALKRECRAATRFYYRADITAPKFVGYKFKEYNQRTVKLALAAIFKGKCAYCEMDCRAGADAEIEHYRPKASIEDEVHTGYWWLAHSWLNMLYSCKACNQRRRVNGQVSAGVHQYEEARTYYDQALTFLSEDDRLPRAVINHDLGVALIGMRKFADAEAAIRKSLELKQALGDVSGQAMSTHLLGNLEMSRKTDLDQAIAFFEEARRLAEQDNDRLGGAISSHQLGNVYSQRKQWDEALRWFRRALAIHEEQDDLRGSGISRRRIGDMLSKLKRHDEALAEYRAALASAHAEGDLRNQQSLHRRLAHIHLDQGQFSEARTEATTALRLAENVTLKAEVVKSLLLLTEVEIGAGNLAGAERYLIDADLLTGGAPDTKRRAADTREHLERRRMELAAQTPDAPS